jgi:hypothetical protein
VNGFGGIIKQLEAQKTAIDRALEALRGVGGEEVSGGIEPVTPTDKHSARSLSHLRQHLFNRPAYRGEKFLQLRGFFDQTGVLQLRAVLVTGRARRRNNGNRHSG